MDIRQISFLLVCFVLYVGIGAVVFMYLESNHNSQEENREQVTLRHIEVSLNLLNLSGPNFIIKNEIIEIIDNRTKEIPETYDKKWGFFNSIFFAVTVVTTIGYGHLSPQTSAGRIFCIVYAIFGIPMTGLLLRAIGERFSRCFLDKFKKLRKRSAHSSNRLLMLKHVLLFFVPWFIVFLVLPSLIFSFIEGWSFMDSFYYCFITLSTIGFGDLVIGQFDRDWVWMYKIAAVLWIIFGLAYLSMILNLISQAIRSRQVTNVVHSIRRISAPPKRPQKLVDSSTPTSTPRSPDFSPNTPTSPDFGSEAPQFLAARDVSTLGAVDSRNKRFRFQVVPISQSRV
ncbi:potassium channel, subfamily K, member 16-like [Brevipalpus obovatus]|uniref:potassium channel, subfamily K, member 16-like n=1 Tax=Brevipalpus obovatus TaxID=246614 RepID=UPI003D9E9942